MKTTPQQLKIPTSFQVSTLHREDLVEACDMTEEETEAISDEQMHAIAKRLEENLLETGAWWEALAFAADTIITED